MHAPRPTADTVDTPRSEIGAWWMIAVLFLLYVLYYIDKTIIAHLVDPIKKSLSISDLQISLILGPAFAFTYALASLPAGWIADHFDRRRVLAVAVFGWSLMTASCGLASSMSALMVARMMQAAFEALLLPTAASMIADRFPPQRLATPLAIYQSGPKVGSSLAYFVAAIAIASANTIVANGGFGARFLPWQVVLFLVGLPGLVLAFLPMTFHKMPAKQAGRGVAGGGDFLTFFRNHRRFFVPMFAGFVLVSIPGGALSQWLPSFMARTYGWSAAQYGPPLGFITALATLIIVPGGLFLDWLYKRGVRDAALRMLSWLMCLACPIGSVIFFLPSHQFLAGMMILQAVALGYSFFTVTTLQLVSPPHLRGRLTGLMLAIVPPFSQGVGPMLVGALTDLLFQDPRRIGAALAIVVTICTGSAFVVLRIALARIAPVLAATTSVSEEPADEFEQSRAASAR